MVLVPHAWFRPDDQPTFVDPTAGRNARRSQAKRGGDPNHQSRRSRWLRQLRTSLQCNRVIGRLLRLFLRQSVQANAQFRAKANRRHGVLARRLPAVSLPPWRFSLTRHRISLSENRIEFKVAQRGTRLRFNVYWRGWRPTRSVLDSVDSEWLGLRHFWPDQLQLSCHWDVALFIEPPGTRSSQ